jgi:hypothetical protein
LNPSVPSFTPYVFNPQQYALWNQQIKLQNKKFDKIVAKLTAELHANERDPVERSNKCLDFAFEVWRWYEYDVKPFLPEANEEWAITMISDKMRGKAKNKI